MTSCSYKAKFTSFYAIDKKPVGFYVAFSAIFQDSFELMIFVFCRQFLSTDQISNDLFQFVWIFTAFDQSLNIFFKLRVSSD